VDLKAKKAMTTKIAALATIRSIAWMALLQGQTPGDKTRMWKDPGSIAPRCWPGAGGANFAVGR
jgi:hypothetical protein